MLDFDEELLRAESPEDLKDMKLWMFREQVRIQAKEEELQELSRELQDLKRKLERERTALELREKNVNKRFDDNEVFIEKKKKIIENAYQQLASSGVYLSLVAGCSTGSGSTEVLGLSTTGGSTGTLSFGFSVFTVDSSCSFVSS